MTYRHKGNAGRVWRWPLRSGLVTVLALMGTQQTLITACGDSEGNNRSGNGGTGSGTGGSTSATGGVVTGWSVAGGCTLDPDAGTVFADEGFSTAQPWPPVIFSWTTAEQVAELRANSVLFSRSERTGLGRGLVFEQLANLAATSQDDVGVLAKLLGEQLFTTARFGWTNPWATRMGWPGEQYGDQLLRIELKPEAWIVEFYGSNLRVSDVNHQNIPLEQALATPERIGAIYFLHSGDAGRLDCVGSFGPRGSGGFREFVLGNLAMVKQWSLATEAIQQKLENDISSLKAFRGMLEACPFGSWDGDWDGFVMCNWIYSDGSEQNGYVQSLALPNEYYVPTVDALTTLIDTLESDPFTVDPFIVDVSP